MKHETNEGVSSKAESQLQRSETGDSGLQQSALSNYDNGSFRSLMQENNQASAAQSEQLAKNNALGKLELIGGSASEQNLQSAPFVQHNYSDRNPWAKQYDELKGKDKTSNQPEIITNKAGPYSLTPPIPANAWHSQAPAQDRSSPKAQERTAPAKEYQSQPAARQQPGPVHRPAPVARPLW